MRPKLVFGMLLAMPSAAFAHAQLVSASPRVGATVHAPPTEVAIVYSEAVEPKFSRIEVHDAAGARVDSGDTHTAPGDGHRLLIGLKPLTPGEYQVVWHATSVDTHKTEGKFAFTVAP